jgi:Coenzyme PQQ synthesis protein D (PqqD)
MRELQGRWQKPSGMNKIASGQDRDLELRGKSASMGKDQAFCVASRNVHSQKFDDEVIIIDTKSGLYFSLRGCAVDIWSEIEAGATHAAIAATLTARYDGNPDAISAALEKCLADLLQDGLIRETASAAQIGTHVASPASKRPFVAPLVERFTDMQNLLLLDPIHEVTEEGWPQQASSKTA